MKRKDVDIDATKSSNDEKKYKYIELLNGLQCLLISTMNVSAGISLHHHEKSNEESEDSEDSEEDEDDDFDSDDSDESDNNSGFYKDDREDHSIIRRAGACLTVGVGSYADPIHLPGLAHYLEHMLFMGSEKYPNENEFEAYLSAHGGYSNGCTDCELTSYTFEVGPQYLKLALDMFAHFFISPLLKEDALDRELSAIESEFHQALQNDNTRVHQIITTCVKENHPYGQFSWGNRKSLKEIPEAKNINVRQEMIQFYQHKYSANIMKLVVCGQDSIEELEEWVRESFNAIPNKNVPALTSYDSYGPPFGHKCDVKWQPLLCKIVPFRDTHVLHLNWMIPSTLGTHHSKPADYIATLLGHEGDGSLHSYLRELGYISSLSAGLADTDGEECGTFGSKFNVSMKLTVNGLQKWQDVVALVFGYLDLIRTQPFSEYIYDELKVLADISFRFQEEIPAVELCEEIAQIMQGIFRLEPADILQYDLYKSDKLDIEFVEKILNDLVPENVLVSLITQKHLESQEFESNVREEEWMGVKYTKEIIPQEIIQQWKHSTPNTNLHLPKRNIFIPRDFTILSKCEGYEYKHCQTDITPFGKMWYESDSLFDVPRANIAFLLHIPTVSQTVENFVLTDIFIKIVQDSLTEYSYHANIAELVYTLMVKECGIEFQFGGFNDKLDVLIKIVVEKFFTTIITRDNFQRFDLVKEETLQTYSNSIIKPSHKARYLRLQMLEHRTFPLPTMIAALSNAKVEQLVEFIDNIFWSKSVFLQTFVHGNVSWETAKGLRSIMESQLEKVIKPRNSASSNFEFSPACIYRMPPASKHGILIQELSEHNEESNVYVEVYFQLGEQSPRDLAYAELIQHLMQEPLFDTLRTKQELGYEVFCQVRLTKGLLGYSICVQSSLVSASHITQCISEFLLTFKETLLKMPQSRYDDYVQSVIETKREPFQNLLDKTHVYWFEISSGRLKFFIDEEIATELEKMTRDEVVTKYEDWLLNSPRKLWIHVNGPNSPVVTNGTSDHEYDAVLGIESLYNYQRTLDVHANPFKIVTKEECDEILQKA